MSATSPRLDGMGGVYCENAAAVPRMVAAQPQDQPQRHFLYRKALGEGWK
jgi:hypothetical protein